MVQLQIINKILDTKSIDIIRDNGFTREYFPEYTNEMIYIMDHYNHYGTVPDKTTFLTKFSDFELFEVNEGDKYLAETLSEEYTYGKLAHVIQKAADLTQSNSFDGVNYLNNESAKASKNETRHELKNLLCFKQKTDDKGNYKWIFKKPWETFTQDSKTSLEKIIVSFQQNLRVINRTRNTYQKWGLEADGTKKKRNEKI